MVEGKGREICSVGNLPLAVSWKTRPKRVRIAGGRMLPESNCCHPKNQVLRVRYFGPSHYIAVILKVRYQRAWPLLLACEAPCGPMQARSLPVQGFKVVGDRGSWQN